jgi:hypothetical protein
MWSLKTLIAPQTETESLGQAGPKRPRPGVIGRGKERREREVWYREKGKGNKEGRGSGEVPGVTS